MKKAQKIKYKVNNKLRGFGETDFERRKITVNKKKNKKQGSRGELINTIVHEDLHLKRPKAKEKTIRTVADVKVKRMSKKEKEKLYKRFK